MSCGKSIWLTQPSFFYLRFLKCEKAVKQYFHPQGIKTKDQTLKGAAQV